LAVYNSGVNYTAGGILGAGGIASGSSGSNGGTGLLGYGGDSNGNSSNGGYGVAGAGGNGVGSFDYPGDGATFLGGGSTYYGGTGVWASGGAVSANWQGGTGIYATGGFSYNYGPNGYAAVFGGDTWVAGNLSKSGGSFQIDHPLDPANKYLYHSFVESPDMKNIYDGTVVTDGSGYATVTLPDWFEALNRDFRYQLTAIGQPAQAWVATKINNNSFAIKTDKPNVEVSWQVTGIRQDAWANAHRIPLEMQKPQADQGRYLHPELFGHAGEPDIPEYHHPRPTLPAHR